VYAGNTKRKAKHSGCTQYYKAVIQIYNPITARNKAKSRQLMKRSGKTTNDILSS